MCGCKAASHTSVFVAFVHYVDFLWQWDGPLLAPPRSLMGLRLLVFSHIHHDANGLYNLSL